MNLLSIPPILARTLFAAFEQPSHVISILNSCFCSKIIQHVKDASIRNTIWQKFQIRTSFFPKYNDGYR